MIEENRSDSMYFVDKEKLELKLNYLKQLTEDYPEQKENHYAFERIAQMLIESSVDIGNMIIDGFVLRDPGNYKDVIDILELEKVISPKTKEGINQTVEVRKRFVHQYDQLDSEDLIPLFDASLEDYRNFIDEVIHFLNNENVPVTAFGKGEH